MAETIAEVMTSYPMTIERTESVAEAARRMAAADAGDVIVVDSGTVCGMVTDRDIAVRVVARDRSPSTPVSEILSDADLQTVTQDMSIDQAIRLMRQYGIRRLPVVEQGRAVGVVSLGNIAIERDPTSVLASICAAEGNT